MKRIKGFTLVEIMLIIAVLAIIVMIAVPALAGIQKRSQIKTDIRNSQQICKAARMWLTDGEPNKLEERKQNIKEIKPYNELTEIENYVTRDLTPIALSNMKFYLGLTSENKVKVIVSDEENKNTVDIYQVNKALKPGIIYIEDQQISF